jgi:hypothetical protein
MRAGSSGTAVSAGVMRFVRAGPKGDTRLEKWPGAWKGRRPDSRISVILLCVMASCMRVIRR